MIERLRLVLTAAHEPGIARCELTREEAAALLAALSALVALYGEKGAERLIASHLEAKP